MSKKSLKHVDFIEAGVTDVSSKDKSIQRVRPVVTKIDIGCGPNKREGFTGVDAIAFPNVDYVCKVGSQPLPFETNSIEEINSSHFLEHLTNLDGKWERVNFFNEMYRVLKPGGKASLVFPHWASNRYYGDPTHKEPFSEMGFYYLSKDWRKGNAHHTDIEHNPNGYDCDFECTWGYSLHGSLLTRNQEYQQFALQNYKESAQDIIANLLKK
jgi:SAM-dependent methyltransferase